MIGDGPRPGANLQPVLHNRFIAYSAWDLNSFATPTPPYFPDSSLSRFSWFMGLITDENLSLLYLSSQIHDPLCTKSFKTLGHTVSGYFTQSSQPDLGQQMSKTEPLLVLEVLYTLLLMLLCRR